MLLMSTSRPSGSKGTPAEPIAVSTRPQFASSPATAVFTSGELAIDKAMRLADASDTAGRKYVDHADASDGSAATAGIEARLHHKDLGLIADADWIVEVIVEQLEPKQALMARIEAELFNKDGRGLFAGIVEHLAMAA